MSALAGMGPIKQAAAQYLAEERQREARHEFADGQTIAMAGAGRDHNLICTNISRSLGNQLSDGPCEIYQSDMRVAAMGAYRYPDLVVVCDDPHFLDDFLDTLTNPTVLIEVLSPSTATDRGTKLWEYRQIPTVQTYLIVATGHAHIEGFLRQPDNTWLLRDTIGLDATVNLEPLGCALALADVYARVTFAEDEGA